MKFLICYLLLLVGLASANDSPASAPTTLNDKSFFVNHASTVVIQFDSVVNEPTEPPLLPKGFYLSDLRIKNTPDSKNSKSVAIIDFVPTTSGILTFPSLSFKSAEKSYLSEPFQIQVSTPQRSEAMRLTFTPEKTHVYVGEPIRVDLTWHCDINAGALQDLHFNPSFFSNKDIKVAIPRNTSPEEKQVGLPIGGRRVIATRTVNESNPKALGTVTLPIYLRFNQAGKVVLPEARLNISKLARPKAMFGHYAAHFNNSFFTPASTEEHFKKLFVLAPAMEFEVLPLPELPATQEFSGLFHPITLENSISLTESSVGQLLEHQLRLTTPVPRELLDLPPLSRSADFDERFVIDDSASKRWAESSTTFHNRLRILSDSVSQIPPIKLLGFNPNTREYQNLESTPIPLKITPSNGQNNLPRSHFHTTTVLIQQAEGIWHNQTENTMQDFIQSIIVALATNALPIVISAILLFFILRPVLLHRRKLNTQARYRKMRQAFQEFKSQASGSPAQAKAFFHWLAVSRNTTPDAWTQSDSIKALQRLGVSVSEIAEIKNLHQSLDQQEFSNSNNDVTSVDLKAIAKKIAKPLQKLTPLITIIVISLMSKVEANEHWAKAEQQFQMAQQANAESKQQFAEAALYFEASADSNYKSGKSLYNAGNAWFNSGDIGRAIAAYRNAEFFLPLDQQVKDNLASARDLVTVSAESSSASTWLNIPRVWLLAALSTTATLLLASLLAMVYLKAKWCKNISIALTAVCLVVFALNLHAFMQLQQSAVVIVDHAIAKKGPSHSFANAFQQPLTDGIECSIIEEVQDWSHIELDSEQRAWVPSQQLQKVQR